MPTFDLNNYIGVQERVIAFWEKYPEGRIVTALASDPDNWDVCRYRAELYADRADERPVATGYAFEIAGKGMANQTSHEENCETSAIGRALANLAFATSQQDRPSREEMQKVQRMHDEIEHGPALRDEGTPAAPRRPPPPRIAAVRTRPPAPEGDTPKGLYFTGSEGEVAEPPSVSRQHGVKDMAGVNDYVQQHGFKGGMKGEVIKEIEGVYGITIASGRGMNKYGEPDVFPSEIYDLAHHLIEGQGASAQAQ